MEISFRGHKIWQCPPNGQGVIALLLLNILSKVLIFVLNSNLTFLILRNNNPPLFFKNPGIS
mgnify:CR=1 FL=1